jgi:K(+)-stimulated pyrophosphate-energized sodium pump
VWAYEGVTLAHDVTKQVTIEKTNVNGAVTATITTVNGKSWNTSFEGTDAVVQTKIDALK